MSDALPPVTQADLDAARQALGLPSHQAGATVAPLTPRRANGFSLDDIEREMAGCVVWQPRPSAHEHADALLVLLALRLAEAHPREPQILAIIGMYQEAAGL